MTSNNYYSSDMSDSWDWSDGYGYGYGYWSDGHINKLFISNLTQDIYYDYDSLMNGEYEILPAFYAKYKMEMEFYDLIKKNLDLPENYKDLRTLEIITNIISYLKVVV